MTSWNRAQIIYDAVHGDDMETFWRALAIIDRRWDWWEGVNKWTVKRQTYGYNNRGERWRDRNVARAEQMGG